MKWKDSGETEVLKKPRDLKPLTDQLHQIGAEPLLKYFLDGSRHVFKVDDIAYNKQVMGNHIITFTQQIHNGEQSKHHNSKLKINGKERTFRL